MDTEVSQDPIKRQKTTDQGKATATATAGVPSFGSLPPELLDTICGFLDVRTLCTARLVCAQLRDAASRLFRSVELSAEDLRRRPETNLNNFPNLSRVSIRDVGNHDLVMLAQSPVAGAVTHLRAVQYLRELRHGHIAPLAHLLPLPNLVSLTVKRTANLALMFPPNLRELTLEAPTTYGTAVLLTRLTNLTCLHIDVMDMLIDMHKHFEAVTALTGLQRLEIWSNLSLIPFVAQLTLLTHLQFRYPKMEADHMRLAVAFLPRLQKLVHLGVGDLSAGMEPDLIASIGTITSLRSMDLGSLERLGRSAFETVCMTPFSQLTALRLDCRGVDASFLPRFNLERLQDLSLSNGVEFDGVGVAALMRATGLTHLHVHRRRVAAGASMGIALSHMSRLRALSFVTTASCEPASCSEAIGLLTGLTRLEWGGREVTPNSAVEACLGLKQLRVLKLMWGSTGGPSSNSECITPETFLAVAMLPELSTFNVSRMIRILGWDLEEFLNYTWARVKADRHDKGWPPLMLTVGRH